MRVIYSMPYPGAARYVPYEFTCRQLRRSATLIIFSIIQDQSVTAQYYEPSDALWKLEDRQDVCDSRLRVGTDSATMLTRPQRHLSVATLVSMQSTMKIIRYSTVPQESKRYLNQNPRMYSIHFRDSPLRRPCHYQRRCLELSSICFPVSDPSHP